MPGCGAWYTGMGRDRDRLPSTLTWRGCLLIDPAVTVADLAALAGELAELGLRPTVAWSTHPHWDHVLWSRLNSGNAPERRARRGEHRRTGRDGWWYTWKSAPGA